jgi:hypothetical protein
MNILSRIVGTPIEAEAGYILNTCQGRYIFSQFAQSRDYIIHQLCAKQLLHFVCFVVAAFP